MARRWLGSLVCLAALGWGCGDPLLGEDFQGNPVLSFEAVQESTTVVAGVPQTYPKTRIALFWSPSGQTDVPVSQLIEQPENSIGLDQPGKLTFRVMALPGPAHLFDRERGLGLALLLAYVDANESGRFEPAEQEKIIGGAKQSAIFYTRDDLAALGSPFGMSRKRGLSLLDIPAACRKSPLELQGDGAAAASCPAGEVRLGASCRTQAECGARGLCLEQLGSAGCPGGYCVASADQGGCVPPGAVALPISESLSLPGCATDAQCARTGFACTETQASGGILSCKICWPRGIGLPQDLICTSTPTTVPAGCGDKVGAACAANAECQQGQDAALCLRSVYGAPVPGGECALPFGSGCFAQNAPRVRFSSHYYLAPCSQDQDCREAEGYGCNTRLRACYPQDLVRVVVDPSFTVDGSMPPLCGSG